MDEEQQSHEMWRRPRPGRPWRLLLAQASTATAAARAEQRLTGVLTMAMREVRDDVWDQTLFDEYETQTEFKD